MILPIAVDWLFLVRTQLSMGISLVESSSQEAKDEEHSERNRVVNRSRFVLELSGRVERVHPRVQQEIERHGPVEPRL